MKKLLQYLLTIMLLFPATMLDANNTAELDRKLRGVDEEARIKNDAPSLNSEAAHRAYNKALPLLNDALVFAGGYLGELSKDYLKVSTICEKQAIIVDHINKCIETALVTEVLEILNVREYQDILFERKCQPQYLITQGYVLYKCKGVLPQIQIFTHACQKGLLPVVEKLVEIDPFFHTEKSLRECYLRTMVPYTLLVTVARNGHLEVLKYLFDLGAYDVLRNNDSWFCTYDLKNVAGSLSQAADECGHKHIKAFLAPYVKSEWRKRVLGRIKDGIMAGASLCLVALIVTIFATRGQVFNL